jgi:hypothetical protein
MMIGATIVKVMLGQESPVYRSLSEKEELLALYHVFGDYDFFLIMQAESLAKLTGSWKISRRIAVLPQPEPIGRPMICLSVCMLHALILYNYLDQYKRLA